MVPSSIPGMPGLNCSEDAHLSALPASVISVYMPVPTPRPIESFTHHFPLSLEAVLAHSQAEGTMIRKGSANDQPSDLLPSLIRSYKADVATNVQRNVADICWVVQTPLRVNNDAVLSFTTTLSSLECCASFLVFYIATTLEGAMLAHELALADGSVHSGTPHPVCSHTEVLLDTCCATLFRSIARLPCCCLPTCARCVVRISNCLTWSHNPTRVDHACADTHDIDDSNPSDDSLLRQLEALATSGMHPHGMDGKPLESNIQFCTCNVREQCLLPAAVSQVRLFRAYWLLPR
jgi:hypothetical protein